MYRKTKEKGTGRGNRFRKLIHPPSLSRLVNHFGLKMLKHYVLEKGRFWPKISVKASTKGFAFRFGPQIWRITAVPQGGRGEGGYYFAC